MALIECRECKAKISDKAKACPQCGVTVPPKTSFLTWVFVGILSVSMFSCIFSSNEPSQQARPAAKPIPQLLVSSSEKEAKAKQEAVDAALLKTKCIDQLEAVMAEAGRLLKAKKISEARDEMERCSQHLIEPKSIAFLDTLRKKNQAELDAKVVARMKAEKAEKKREGVRVGMSAQDVFDSSWGKPQKVNRTIGSYGVHEQWVYGGGSYLYFEKGILRTIQN